MGEQQRAGDVDDADREDDGRQPAPGHVRQRAATTHQHRHRQRDDRGLEDQHGPHDAAVGRLADASGLETSPKPGRHPSRSTAGGGPLSGPVGGAGPTRLADTPMTPTLGDGDPHEHRHPATRLRRHAPRAGPLRRAGRGSCDRPDAPDAAVVRRVPRGPAAARGVPPRPGDRHARLRPQLRDRGTAVHRGHRRRRAGVPRRALDRDHRSARAPHRRCRGRGDRSASPPARPLAPAVVRTVGGRGIPRRSRRRSGSRRGRHRRRRLAPDDAVGAAAAVLPGQPPRSARPVRARRPGTGRHPRRGPHGLRSLRHGGPDRARRGPDAPRSGRATTRSPCRPWPSSPSTWSTPGAWIR